MSVPSVSLSVLNAEPFEIIFVNVANEYDPDMNCCDIMEVSRGCWRVSKKRRPVYLFATHDSVVIGIYRITAIHSEFDTYDYPIVCPRFPNLNALRKLEKQLLDDLRTLNGGRFSKDYARLTSAAQEKFDECFESSVTNGYWNKSMTVGSWYNKWSNRVYFSCTCCCKSCCNSYGTELTRLNREYLGRKIVKINKKGISRGLFDGAQNPVAYN